VQAVLRLPQPAHAVLITGDLTDFGRTDEYAHLRRLLQPLRCPVYLLPGNHDDRKSLCEAFPDHGYLQQAAGGFLQYAVDLGGLRLVAGDTVAQGQPHGELCAARLRQLDTLLAQDARTPTMLALHHPPFATGIGHMDAIGLRQADALAAVVRRHPQVDRVVCGHLHRSVQARWAGTLAMTAPSTAHQVCLDLAADAASAYTMEPPGFVVHAWSDRLPLVSHLVAIGVFDGPHPFHADGALID
jgi:3',5'-cyclic AMP phosphodiesterase CpdA